MLMHAPGDPHLRSETWRALEDAKAQVTLPSIETAQGQSLSLDVNIVSASAHCKETDQSLKFANHDNLSGCECCSCVDCMGSERNKTQCLRQYSFLFCQIWKHH